MTHVRSKKSIIGAVNEIFLPDLVALINSPLFVTIYNRFSIMRPEKNDPTTTSLDADKDSDWIIKNAITPNDIKSEV